MISPWQDQPRRNTKSNDAKRRRRTRDRRAGRSRRRIRPIVALLEDRTLLTPTLITLAVSSDSLTYGQAEVFTATVTSDPPGGTTPTGGTVTFLDGSATIGNEALSHGTAMLSTTALPVGQNVMTADYSGSGAFASSVTGSGVPTITTAVSMESVHAPIRSVAADSSGDIFVAASDPFIQEVLTVKGGQISVFVGGGTSTALDYSGPATGLDMYEGPEDVAVYGGNAYIVAEGDVYKVDIATDQMTTVVPTGANPSYDLNASALAVDGYGNLFIACGDDVIREVSAATGDASIVAGNGTAGYSGDGGPATDAELYDPSSVAVDSGGDIFIDDTGNSVIREVSAATGDITTVAGGGAINSPTYSGLATGAQVGAAGVAAASGTLYIADSSNNVVRAVNIATDQMTTVAGDGTAGYSGDGGAASAATLNLPNGVALSSSGNILIADEGNSVIREVSLQAVAQTVTVTPASSGGGSTGQAQATVANVSVQKIRTGKKTTEAIVLQFSEAMNFAAAQNVTGYSLVTIPKSKKTKSKPVALAKASYNSTTFTVTLTTRKALVLSTPLKLTVKAASLMDDQDQPLDGGVNVVAILSKSGATVTSAVPLVRASGLSTRAVDAVLGEMFRVQIRSGTYRPKS
jgi:Bacterial Ig-like domain (group 3)